MATDMADMEKEIELFQHGSQIKIKMNVDHHNVK
jgi:hypothetical protein